jgi:regulator of sirC expression with transglutaminase-like and TPR domain
MNLRCASGLPGADDLDDEAAVEAINAWANHVRAATEKWQPMFARSPQNFNHSLAEFQILAMVTVLQRDLGLRYNLSFSDGEYNASDSRNLFLHGLTSGYGGTCVTMPVLYIAVGRRLGYPLHLVRAYEHFFVRWQDGKERFNIEATSPGFEPLDDDYYRTWPKALSEADIASGMYLRNLRPREILASFLHNRGQCLFDNLRIGEATHTFRQAAELAPHDPAIKGAWVVSSLLFQRLLHAEIEATRVGRQSIDLRTISLREPEPQSESQRWVVATAREQLNRVINIHPGDSSVNIPLFT